MKKRFNLGLFPRRQGGNHKIADVTVNLGSTKGRGSSTRMFNYCKKTSENPSGCINQFINISPVTSTSTPTPTPTPTYDYTFTGTGELNQTTVNNEIGTAQNIFIVGYTSIGNYAFLNKTQIISVTFGNTLTSIGINALGGCTSLSSVTIPNSVTIIDDSAFNTCTTLESVTIGNSVVTIGNDVFTNCTALISVIFTPTSTLTNIGQSVFEDCNALTSITIPNSVTSIGTNAFQNSGLTTVTISDAEAIYLGNQLGYNWNSPGVVLALNFYGAPNAVNFIL
jgi:hypothetical protein